MPIGRYESGDIRDLRKGGRECSIDEAIAQIAELQAGQIHRDQLRDLGLNTNAINYRLRTGRLRRSRWCVYGVGHRRDDTEAVWHAAILTSGDGSALSHRAGAARLGIRPVSGGDVEVTVPRQRRAREGLRHIWRELPPDEITVHDGLPVTSPMRTLFDLAGALPQRLFLRAVKEVEVQGLADALSLALLLERHPHPPGAAAIRSVIDHPSPPPNTVPSDGEDLFAELCERARIERPVHRYGIALRDGWVEVDFAWPHLRVAVEVDSSFHEVGTAFEDDRSRDQSLIADGWLVFRVTWRQLTWEPSLVLARLERLLVHAADRRP